MAGKKKFGTFAGVFTPSILTILGVIMYMRMGWVVGNAGLIGTIIIILIAHVIAVSTGLTRYLNHIEQTNQFVQALDYNEGVENELSFYYKKLFTGSHLGHLNPLYKNKELTAAYNAVGRIDSGVSGALMIIGESLSGKTFFIENISNSLITGEKVFVNPPVKQSFDASDIRRALQNSFGKKGSAESILNHINPKTILIFDDLENWWVKAPKGNKAINYLAELIEKFGNKHYFLLSCNIFSFDIIRQVSHLEKQLLATIIVPPASKSELKEILWNRHRTAGAELWYNNQVFNNTKKNRLLL